MEHLATIVLETFGAVARITLNRPQQLNALNDVLMDELGATLKSLDADDRIAAIVITGSEKAFAAGADIKVMASLDFETAYTHNFITRNWDTIRTIRKPIIAAVAGFALGGGCELALACDTIVAADNAQFGQPEIKLGIIPGAGGTQRLTRAIGKAKAMDMILTGRMMNAVEAEQAGLVARVVPLAELNDTAMNMAQTIAGYGRVSVMMAKEAVNVAQEQSLSDGLLFERRGFHSLFATKDQKEGMAAFIEKRAPSFGQNN
ncbi:enoyl-CoA hydratase [Hydromonas duriensis]|uniref:enoyl-CoA hydratase n=1 Tax=Hydromonas duriensis TaxID=1527608 RepID=A0A4R6YA36_9BURK|nr:enoyl-CoA hydratase [Hydromonas duriensis]TDR32381.1 short chain enoyl-CoA hydratase [Hydromonas duriensis]